MDRRAFPTRGARAVPGRPRTSCSTPRASGLTLLELVIAIAILGILTAVAVPSFRATAAESRLKDAQRSLAATLRSARAESGMRRERIVVCARASDTACGGDWAEGWIAFVDGAAGTPLALDAGETVLRVEGPKSGGQISIVATQRAPWSTQTLPTASVGVESRVRGATTLFVLCDERGVDRARVIVSDPAGSVRTDLGRNASGQRLGPWNEPLGCPA